jgi:anti-sigma factor RsiW
MAMNNDLLNILSNSNKDIDNQQLMDYLSGKLSAAEKHEVEKSMADSDFMNDAVEGLQNIPDQEDVQRYVGQLNSDLQKSLQKKKQRRLKRRLKENPWGYFAVLLILLLCIIAYLVVRKFLLFPR